MNGEKRLLLVILVLICAGCSHIDGYVDIMREKGLSKEYIDSLRTWTRSQIVYSEFETRAHIRVTYQGSEFKKAYIDEYARVYHLSDAEKKIREEAQRSVAAEFTEFFFYAYTPEKESNDFSRERSVWTVYLMDDSGGRLDPVEIRKIDPVTPVITAFYPYINPAYGFCYSLKFPPLSKEKPFKLIFTSVIAKVELDWN